MLALRCMPFTYAKKSINSRQRFILQFKKNTAKLATDIDNELVINGTNSGINM